MYSHLRPSTRNVTLGTLAETLHGSRIIGDPATILTDITYDSRFVRPGGLFAALIGGEVDGHDFARRAANAGAAALLVEREQDVETPQIVVSGSSRAALAIVSCECYGHPSHELTVIGITGTDGKTTTSAMLEGILQGTGHQVGAIGTVGVRIGNGDSYDLGHQTTPESNHVQRYLREMVDAGIRFAVIEATSHGLATHRLDGVRFAMAGVTNITHEHLEYHKTIGNYRRAKATLLERVASHGGVVVLNNEDEGARSIRGYADGANCRTYSAMGKDADIMAVNVQMAGHGSAFDVVVGNNVLHAMLLPVPGRFNVANALCALGLAEACGVPMIEATRALERAKPVAGRMQPVDVGQPFRVIVDYAHTPESIRTILTLLRSQYTEGRLLVVTGSAGERDVEKRPLQGAACAQVADITIVTSEDPRHEDPDLIIGQIVEGAVNAGAVRGETVLAITDRREAITVAFDFAEPGDCVLLAGKGHETSIIWGDEHRPWNEVDVAEELLRDLAERSE